MWRKNGKKHSFNLAENFAKNKSGGTKVTYTNPIAVSKNGGWRYNYGNMFYVCLVNQYLAVPSFSDATAQAIFNEALKYQGWKYVFGGSNPNTSFDCSGFVSWVINHCGNDWNVGRQTANGLMGKCDIIPKSEAKPGDLIFFQKTYNTSGASHVGIYVGNGMMIHCGSPISYASIETSYWRQHYYCMGRIR